MKKKAASIVIANILLIAALTACGSNDNASKSDGSSDVFQSEGSSNEVSPFGGSDTPIGTTQSDNANDSDSEDGEDITDDTAGSALSDALDEETVKRQYAATIFEAFQNLDAEAMKPFLGNDYEYAVKVFDLIKNDPDDLAFWNNTIGNMVYLPDSDVLITKSCAYITSKWYTDCRINNEDLPASASEDFPKEYLDEIYNNYYVDAPYTLELEFADQIISEWSDGAMCHFFSLTDAMGMDHFSFSTYHPNHLRAAILLNRAESFSLGYEYIAEDIPEYEDLLSRDLDKMMALLDGVIDVENPSKYSLEETYRDYFMNDENRAVLQQFFYEKCESYTNLGTICFFFPLDVDKIFPYSYVLTQADKDTIKNMGIELIYESGPIRSFPVDFDRNFSPYRELVDCAKSFGLVE